MMTTDEMWKQSPPYVSYKTFDKLINNLKELSPSHLDMSYLSDKFSISTGTQLMYAMRYLKLIDENNRPMPRLKLLASGATGEHRAAILRQVADETYPFIFRGTLDIRNATYAEVQDVFLNNYRMESSVCRKCIEFFIEFSKDAGIPISPQLIKERQKLSPNSEKDNTTHKMIEKDKSCGKSETKIKDNRLEQVTFLHALAQDFEHFDQTYTEARKILCEYKSAPTHMWSEEWLRVVGALEEYYKSVSFLYKIAQLTELRIIDMDLLYIFYHGEITENLTFKLRRLIEWCGTGLDLAADYNPFELARIAGTLVNLYEKLNNIHQEQGNGILLDADILNDFNEYAKDFLANPGEFQMNSPRVSDRFVYTHDREKIDITPEIQNVIDCWDEFAKANDIEFYSSEGYWAKRCLELNGACILKPSQRPICPCKECLSEIKRDGHCFCHVFRSHEYGNKYEW
jgi:hypothetical protein